MANQIFRAGILGRRKCSGSTKMRKSIPHFIHKMKIAAKEADEVSFFLELCQASPFYPNTETLLQHIKEISLILSKSFLLSKEKLKS